MRKAQAGRRAYASPALSDMTWTVCYSRLRATEHWLNSGMRVGGAMIDHSDECAGGNPEVYPGGLAIVFVGLMTL